MGVTPASDSITVLIKSSNQETLELLRGSLPSEHFKVVILEAEASFVEVVRSERPEIAVIGCVDQSPDAAQLEIDFLKSIRPNVRIIALSEHPSANDARIVERGLFYYLANPLASDLLRVIEAAACGIWTLGRSEPWGIRSIDICETGSRRVDGRAGKEERRL